MAPLLIGYARVSTDQQDVTAQREARRNLLRKLDCRSRVQAVHRAGELDLLA